MLICNYQTLSVCKGLNRDPNSIQLFSFSFREVGFKGFLSRIEKGKKGLSLARGKSHVSIVFVITNCLVICLCVFSLFYSLLV